MCQIQNAFIIRSYCVFLYCTLYSFIGLRDEYHIYVYVYMYICIFIHTHTHARARGKKIKRKRERIEVCLSTIKRHDLSSIISFRCLHSLVEGTKPLRRGPFLSLPWTLSFIKILLLEIYYFSSIRLDNFLFFFYFYFDLYLYSSFYQRLFIVGR